MHHDYTSHYDSLAIEDSVTFDAEEIELDADDNTALIDTEENVEFVAEEPNEVELPNDEPPVDVVESSNMSTPPEFYCVIVPRLCFRSGPSLHSSPKGVLYNGTVVSVDNRIGSWAQVTPFCDGEGNDLISETGYVMIQYLQKVDG